jgi:integrase
MLGLGPAADVDLRTARERAKAARLLLADKIDPLTSKRAAVQAARLAAARGLSFRAAAQGYYDQNQPRWRSRSHREAFLAVLELHVHPTLGSMDVAAVETGDVLRALEKLWAEKPITADRARSFVEAIIDWSIVRGHRPAGVNPARWSNHLDQILPRPRKVKPVAHYAALDFKHLPKFMTQLRQLDGVAARALEFVILTAVRSSEALDATWDEIDLDSAIWTIPPQRTKSNRQHRAPLSGRVLEILQQLPRESGNPLVFIGPGAGGGLSKTAMLDVLKRLGRAGEATPHGFRASFRTWAGEATSFAPDIAEAALSHICGNATTVAYARGDLFEKRARLMSAWSEYLQAPPVKTDAVVLLRAGR